MLGSFGFSNIASFRCSVRSSLGRESSPAIDVIPKHLEAGALLDDAYDCRSRMMVSVMP
jgi:hypothetical protein